MAWLLTDLALARSRGPANSTSTRQQFTMLMLVRSSITGSLYAASVSGAFTGFPETGEIVWQQDIKNSIGSVPINTARGFFGWMDKRLIQHKGERRRTTLPSGRLAASRR